MVFRSQDWSTDFNEKWYSNQLWFTKVCPVLHFPFHCFCNGIDKDYEMSSFQLLLRRKHTDHMKPVLAVSPNGTIHLVDCQSRKLLLSYETGEPTYAQHHSKDSEYYLDYQSDHTLLFVKNKLSLVNVDHRGKFVANDVGEFLRKKHEKYLDGGRLAWEIKSTEYLFDCKTLKLIDTIRVSQQKPERVEHDGVLSVKRIDYELDLSSSTNGKPLWHLKFARFDAWYEPRMRENMPYVKHYINVYQARCHHILSFLLEMNDIDEDDTKVIKPSKREKKNAKGGNSTNAVEVNGDKDVEKDRYYFEKSPEAFRVSMSCICTLDELILPGQVKETRKVKMMELLKPIDWLKVKRDIAEALANLHKNGIAHGDLNPHNVYIDIQGNAIIPQNQNAKNSSLTADMAMDRYNMGRILLFIETKGEREFCDCTDDLLAADVPEARDITAKLLVHKPDSRLCSLSMLSTPTWKQVLSHRLFWNPERRMSYLECATGYLNAEERESVFTKRLEKVKSQVFKGAWSIKINPVFIQAMSDHRNKNQNLVKNQNPLKNQNPVKNKHHYDVYSLCDLLRFIRNSKAHYEELPEEIHVELGSNRDIIEKYWRGVFPKLLDEVYKVFDEHYLWKGTTLEEYHST